MASYFKDPVLDKGLEEFLKDGFSVRDGYSTLLFKETFDEPELINRNCHAARRSFYDLVDICKTYFPSVTEEEVAAAFNALDNPYIFFCRDIQKIVFMRLREAPYGNARYDSSCLEEKGCDGFILQNYLELL